MPLFTQQAAAHSLLPYRRRCWRLHQALPHHRPGCSVSGGHLLLSHALLRLLQKIPYGHDLFTFIHPTCNLQAWSVLDFPAGVAAAGQGLHAVSEVVWAADYLTACHLAPYRYVGLIGDPGGGGCAVGNGLGLARREPSCMALLLPWRNTASWGRCHRLCSHLVAATALKGNAAIVQTSRLPSFVNCRHRPQLLGASPGAAGGRRASPRLHLDP